MTSGIAFQRSLIALAALTLLGSGRAEAKKARGDAGWARVESLQPGRPTRLILFSAEAPPGARKLKGFFSSATESSVTVVLKSGQTRTVQREALEAVRVGRAARRRYGWIPGAATTLVLFIDLYGEGDLEPRGKAMLIGLFSAPAWALGYLLMPSSSLIYRAPIGLPRRR